MLLDPPTTERSARVHQPEPPPLLSGFYLSPAVYAQTRNGDSPARGQTLNLPRLFVERKMFAPRIPARVKEVRLLPRQLVHGPDTIGFVKITRATGESQIIDLRHFATTMLFIEGVPDAIIRKMTGHRSEELERYKHLSASFKQQSVELIAGQLTRQLGTKLGTLSETAPENTNGLPEGRPQVLRLPLDNGGADGTRTRDLRRDRPAF
jgi:hypothetical protein